MDITELNNKLTLLYNGELSGRDGEPLSRECKMHVLKTEAKHLFCAKENFPKKISTFVLTCLSYNNDLEGNQLKYKINESISNCESCLLNHYNERCELYYYLSNVLNMNHIKLVNFFQDIDLWRAHDLMSLKDLLSFKTNKVDDSDKKEIILLDSDDDDDIQIIDSPVKTEALQNIGALNKSQTIFINEILLNPNLLKTEPQCDKIFNEIILFSPNCIKITNLVKENMILPAIINQHFKNTDSTNWTSEILKDLSIKNSIISYKECNVLTPIIFELVNESIKTQTNIITKQQYYFKIAPILQILDKDVLSNFFNLKQLNSINKSYPNYRPFLHQVIADLNDKSDNSLYLHYLFRIIKIVFQKFGEKTWTLYLKDVKVEHFAMFLRAQHSKLVLKQQIIKSQDRLSVDLFDSLPHLSDFIEWVNEFFYSLKTSLDMLFFSRSYVNFVLKFVDENYQFQNIPTGLLTCSGCVYLNKLLSINDENEQNGISNNNMIYLEDKLTDVLPYRGVMNKETFLQTLVNYSLKCRITINSDNTEIIEKITEPIFNLLFTCLQIDLNVLILTISKLQTDQKSIKTEEIKMINPTVYDYIIRNLNFYSLNECQKEIFTKNLFNHLKDVYLVVNLSNYTTLIKEKTDKVNANFFLIMGKITDIINKMESDDYGFISNALSKNQNVLYGFWSCIFSDNRLLYSKTVGLLYFCFDEEDRISNFYKLLSSDVENNLTIVTNILENLCDKHLFEPCHFGITVLQDLIDAMVILIKKEFSTENIDIISTNIKESLFKFWKSFWKFIKTLYETAYKWAHILRIDVLLEFCKNAMDLHKLAVESVVWFEKILKDKTKYDLITPVLDVLIISPSWLKLNDEPLVEQCINLLVYILNMAHKNWNKPVAKVITYEIFSVANKKDPETGKIKNSLTTEEQRQKLIDVLYEVDPDYVGKLSKKLSKFSKFDPNSREDADVKIISSSKTAHSNPNNSVKYALKGSKLSIPSLANVLKKSAASSSKPVLLSSKDKAEEQLRIARASNGRVIHPASNNVFNDFSKKKSPQMSSSSSDDDDEDDVDEIKAMFGISKQKSNLNKQNKKQGITMVDEFGNEIVKETKHKGEKKMSLAELQKIEKNNMEKRLKVDTNPFYQEILRWNFRNKSDYPYENFNYQKTKIKYDTTQEYQQTMGPLLLLETWQQLIRSKQLESQKVITIDVTNRITVGSFFVVFATVPTSLWEKCGFTDSDICGLGCNKGKNNKSMAPQSSKNFETLDIVNYAKIDEVKNTRGDLKEISIKISLESEIAGFVSPGSFLYLTKITSVVTSEREYTTLYGLPYYNLLEKLMTSIISTPLKPSSSELKNTVGTYNVNVSQAEAIIGATTSEGISLVQGPPGTGKSKTIVSMMKYYFDKAKINFEEMPTNKKRVLLCAPSNAAIDELLVRLASDTKLNLVRIGRKDAVNIKVQHLVLNELIEGKLKKPELISIDNNKYQEEVKKRNDIKNKIEAVKSKIDDPDSMNKLNQLRVDLTMCNDTLNVMRKEKDSIRETNNVFRRKSEFEKKNLTQKILSEADIVCCTLSGAAQFQLQSLGIYFPTVVVDEACQCTELSSLVPLRYGAKQIIMVGDPNQLPPTVISNVASDANYDESLFSRLIQGNHPYLLNVQYRMHPEISSFPSKQFYNSKLKDGPDMARLNEKQWHKDSLFKPYKFFSVVDGKEEKSASLSLSNTKEAEFTLELVDTLLKRFPKVSFKNQIGIVSPYKEQVRLIRRLFEMRYGSLINQTVAIETVDSFQGQEKTIMIFSCVRSSDTSTSIGFLRDFRRLNVALTRGKSNMWIVGNSNMLRKDKLWGNLIRDAESRNVVVEADYKLFDEQITNNGFNNVSDEDDGDYNIKPMKKGNSIIGKKRELENSESSKKIKKTKLSDEPVSKKVSLTNVETENDLNKKKNKKLKKVSLNDSIDTGKNKTSLANKVDSSNNGVKNKTISFIVEPTIKMYRKKNYEDELFGPVTSTAEDNKDEMALDMMDQAHFGSVKIDGTSKQKKPIKKNVLDMSKYKNSKAMKAEVNEGYEEEDEYELPPSKKQKLGSVEEVKKEKEEEENKNGNEDEDDDEDAYIPVTNKGVSSNNAKIVDEDEDDDEYKVTVFKGTQNKNNMNTTKITKNIVKNPKKQKKKQTASPFIKDPYKLLKMQKKKAKNNK
ncbi:hypothetical protein ACO0SA_002042 [Hanseniaspora valbyensis]